MATAAPPIPSLDDLPKNLPPEILAKAKAAIADLEAKAKAGAKAKAKAPEPKPKPKPKAKAPVVPVAITGGMFSLKGLTMKEYCFKLFHMVLFVALLYIIYKNQKEIMKKLPAPAQKLIKKVFN